MEDHWVRHLHSVWSVQLSYKLWVFPWLDIFQGITSKARLAKSGLLDGLCPVYQCLETVRHIFWECQFAKRCWSLFEDQHSMLFQGRVHWHAALFSDGQSLVCKTIFHLWEYLQITVLVVLEKSGVSLCSTSRLVLFLLSDFGTLQKDEVCHQLLSKGALFIKATKSLDPFEYSAFISALVSLWKRL